MALRPCDETSWIVPVLVRLSPIEPLLAPVVPAFLAVTVQVAEWFPPSDGDELSLHSFPTRRSSDLEKLPVPTLLTGSLKVTVQSSGPELAGLACAPRLIEET